MTSKIIYEALAFDDVLIVTQNSDVLPKDADVTTVLTGDIRLRIPLISSAMDTVTESKMAAAIARHGGLGIIHKANSVAEQAEKVRMVKRSQSWKINRPYILGPQHTLNDMRKLMEEKNVSSALVVDGDNILVGIVTHQDIKFKISSENPVISSLMTPREKLITAGPNTTIQEAQRLFELHHIEKLPLVDEQGKLVGLITAKDIVNPVKYPLAVTDKQGRLLVGAAIGTGADLLERASALVEVGVDVLCFDSAHGFSQGVLSAVLLVKQKYPSVPMIAGNISTAEGALALIKAGADVIKVGQGAGSICTTRVVTGCGMPQFSAVLNVAEAVKAYNAENGIKVTVIADGGIRYSGDIAKAIAAGADSVMIGSLFAGTIEAPGETITIQGRPFKVYRGMGSDAVMKKTGGDRYFQNTNLSKAVPEGIEGAVPLRGSVSDTIYQLVGGLRSAMGYAGAKDIPSFQQAKFVLITAAGGIESHPHNVTVIKEAPNYQEQ